MDGPLCRIQFSQRAACIVQIDFSGSGQPHGPPGPVQQLHVQQIFQLLDLLRQRRLRDAQHFGRTREAMVLGHREQVADRTREDDVSIHSQSL